MKSFYWRVMNWWNVGHTHDPFAALCAMCHCWKCSPRKPGQLGYMIQKGGANSTNIQAEGDLVIHVKNDSGASCG